MAAGFGRGGVSIKSREATPKLGAATQQVEDWSLNKPAEVAAGKTSGGGSARKGPVLVAVDFTPDSEAALIWACEYAALAGAEVTVLHVVHDPADAPGSYRAKDSDLLRPMQDVAAGMMKEFLDKWRAKRTDLPALRDAEALMVKGIPATRILEQAKLQKASIIVMGSRGHTGLPHLLLGSKAERVVQLAKIPVTIVKANKNGD